MIGIFDSGIGGLTVARGLIDRLPGYDTIFCGDTARFPYGNKHPETIVRDTLRGTAFLSDRGAQMIVIACHTASSLAADPVVQAYDIPVFEGITPAAALAVRLSRKSGIGVIGTRAMTESGAYERKIKAIHPDARVCSAASPLLVPLAEEGWIKKPETRMIIKKYLHPLKVRQIDTLILGCNHYAILKDIIQRKIGKRVRLVDPVSPVADQVAQFLNAHPEMDALMGKQGRHEFFVSDLTEATKRTANIMFGKNIRLEVPRAASD